MDNYQFCVEWAASQRLAPQASVLDYGCGAGQIVKALRSRGVDARGCDVFYEGGDYSAQVGTELLGDTIRRIGPDGRIPFDDESFDLVINNQVMEHVVDLERVLAEIHRVLKPGGRVLSLFPDRGVWREGHCGIPFLHWFPKGSRPRIYYAAGLCALGLGYHKQGKTPLQWSAAFCDWLDRWTWYRSNAEIDAAYGRNFSEFRHLEAAWLQQRLGERARVLAWLPEALRRMIVTKLGCRVFVVRKSAAGVCA